MGFGHFSLPKIVLKRELLVRVALVAALVILSHTLKWHCLRFVTSEAVRCFSNIIGLSAERVSFDTVRIDNTMFRFVVSCTFIDVFAGCIPLLWRRSDSLIRNMKRIVGAGFVLFSFNLFRLEMSQLLYASGVSWNLADQLVAGVSYFAVWTAIARVQTWDIDAELEAEKAVYAPAVNCG